MELEKLIQQVDFYRQFKSFPMMLAIRDNIQDVYIYSSSEVNWSGMTFDEWNDMPKKSHQNFWVMKDRERERKKYHEWINKGGEGYLRLTFRVKTVEDITRWIQCHFEFAQDDPEHRYVLEVSWDISEVIDNCFLDKSIQRHMYKKINAEREKLKAQIGMMRRAIETLYDPERLRRFCVIGERLSDDKIVKCFKSMFINPTTVYNSKVGWVYARILHELENLEHGVADLSENQLESLIGDANNLASNIQNVQEAMNSYITLLRIYRNDTSKFSDGESSNEDLDGPMFS